MLVRCEEGYYYKKHQNTCLPCVANCKWCKNSNRNHCYECKDDFLLQVEHEAKNKGKCIPETECSEGQTLSSLKKCLKSIFLFY